jgi:hypothetical protein
VTSRVLLRILQPLMHYLNKKWSIDRYLQLWLAGWLSQYSVWLRTGRQGDCGSIPGRGERIFPLTSVSRPALGSIQPPVQWVLGVHSLGLKRGRGVTLTTHPHLMPRLRMSRSYTSSPPRRLRGVYWDSFSFNLQLYLYLIFFTTILRDIYLSSNITVINGKN